MNKVNDHPFFVSSSHTRQRKLIAREGLRAEEIRVFPDHVTAQAGKQAQQIIANVFNLKVSRKILVRRALRFYAQHLLQFAKVTKEQQFKKPQDIYDLLDALELERAELYSAACHTKCPE